MEKTCGTNSARRRSGEMSGGMDGGSGREGLEVLTRGVEGVNERALDRWEKR